MRIQTRVFLTILICSILLVVVMTALMQWRISHDLIQYVNERQRARFVPVALVLQRIYEKEGWGPLRQNPALFRRIATPRGLDEGRRRPPVLDERGLPPSPPFGPGGHRPALPPPAPLALVDTDHEFIAGYPQPFDSANKIAIKSHGKVVGWLLLPRANRLTQGFDIRFEAQQRSSFIVIAVIIVAFAGLFAILLSPGIVRPIRRIARAANRLAGKNYKIRLDERRSDEIGDLARDINELALTLHHSDETQKRWLADTSHELRTPVAIIRGEIEAMLDGVRPLSMTQLESVKLEVLQLQKLIEDLSDLSNADIGSLSYHKERIDLNELLLDNAERYRHLCEEHGLRFEFQGMKAPARVYGDDSRLQQLVGNLISNSCKYTDAPGEVSLAISCDRRTVTLTVDDTPPGVPDESLPTLFEYLFRAESSRNRQTGGAGLGLAIASRIVEAHDGHITAGHSAAGGLKITVQLPLERRRKVRES